MKQSIVCIALAVFFSYCTSKETGNPSAFVKLDSIFQAVPDFSGVVLVAKNGKPVYHRAMGYRNFETKALLDTNAVFELASVSKQFTAMTIMILKEKALLTYDDPVEKFIPGLPYHHITIRHLLNHTSGLPDYQAVMDQYWDKSKVAGNDDNIEYLKKYHPEKRFEPGTAYEYSNTGYMLLASIAEKASGKDFIQYCREKIFNPLHMAAAGIRTREEKKALPSMAWGHLYVPEKQRYVPADSFPQFNYAIWLGNRKGPGRISASATDLLKWDEALYASVLVRPETLREAFTPATLRNDSLSYYGFGWQIRNSPALGNIVQHSGDNPGYKTMIVRYLDQHKTVILLCNNAHPGFTEILDGVEKIVVDL